MHLIFCSKSPDHYCVSGVAIPGSRSTERIEENARGAELQLSPEAVKEIRQLTEAAEPAGERYGFDVAAETIPLSEWKGE